MSRSWRADLHQSCIPSLHSVFSGMGLDPLHVWSEDGKITEDEWMNDNYGQLGLAGEGPNHYQIMPKPQRISPLAQVGISIKAKAQCHVS